MWLLSTNTPRRLILNQKLLYSWNSLIFDIVIYLQILDINLTSYSWDFFELVLFCLKMFWIGAIFGYFSYKDVNIFLLFKLIIFVFTHMFLFFSLGPLVNKVKEFQVETIVDTLCSNMISDKEQLRDISSIGKLLLALSFTLYLYPDLSFSMTFTVYFRVGKICISQ